MRKEIQINQADGDGVLCAIHRVQYTAGVLHTACGIGRVNVVPPHC